jgi:chromate reductase, NAD(P)H dehydrogenase (quinone)
VTDLTIFGISGSLRTGSYNSALLRAAVSLAPAGMKIEVYSGLRALPPYDQDLDSSEPPPSVADLRARIRAADGLLIATPEYNYGVPGVLKNAIDWASRPAATSPLKRKPTAVMGAAPGAFGSVRAQLSLRQSLLWTDSDVVTKPELMVFQAGQRFDAAGNLIDAQAQEVLRALLSALAARCCAMISEDCRSSGYDNPR